jgi:hypothetical protein
LSAKEPKYINSEDEEIDSSEALDEKINPDPSLS